MIISIYKASLRLVTKSNLAMCYCCVRSMWSDERQTLKLFTVHVHGNDIKEVNCRGLFGGRGRGYDGHGLRLGIGPCPSSRPSNPILVLSAR